MTDPSPSDKSQLPSQIAIHGGTVTINIYQSRSRGGKDEDIPLPQDDPVIIASTVECENNGTVKGTGSATGTFPIKAWAKVICADDEIDRHQNPWSRGGPPTEVAVGANNELTITNVPRPVGCTSYRLLLWGIYQNSATFVLRQHGPFTCGSGSGSGSGGGARILGAAAGTAIKGAARQFRLRAEFPAGDPSAAGLPEGIDFGTPANPPLLRFDEAAGWIVPTWNQVQPEPTHGQWQLRMLERDSQRLGELSWQNTRGGVRTLGLWVASQCSCLKKTRFTLQGAPASATNVPSLWLEPA